MIAMIISYALLHESVTRVQVGGGILIIAGIALSFASSGAGVS